MRVYRRGSATTAKSRASFSRRVDPVSISRSSDRPANACLVGFRQASSVPRGHVLRQWGGRASFETLAAKNDRRKRYGRRIGVMLMEEAQGIGFESNPMSLITLRSLALGPTSLMIGVSPKAPAARSSSRARGTKSEIARLRDGGGSAESSGLAELIAGKRRGRRPGCRPADRRIFRPTLIKGRVAARRRGGRGNRDHSRQFAPIVSVGDTSIGSGPSNSQGPDSAETKCRITFVRERPFDASNSACAKGTRGQVKPKER